MPNYKSDIRGSGKAQSGFIAFGFFVFSVIALFLPDPSQDEVASLLRGSVLRPFILAQEALVRRSIHAEDTEVLQARLDSLEVVIANSNTLSEENTRLRSLLDLSDRNSAQYVAASVIRVRFAGFGKLVRARRGNPPGGDEGLPGDDGRGSPRCGSRGWGHQRNGVGLDTSSVSSQRDDGRRFHLWAGPGEPRAFS